MGTRQSRSGQGQTGTGQPTGRQQNPQGAGPQVRDTQRNEQSDQGTPEQRGSGQHQQRAAGAQDKSADRKTSGQQTQQDVHGEGNYAASRQYNDATKRFTESGRVESAARAAAPKSESDARQMEAAEAEGKRHAKGEDPALNRTSSPATRDSSPAPRPGKDEE
jgi:hypothetical protein